MSDQEQGTTVQAPEPPPYQAGQAASPHSPPPGRNGSATAGVVLIVIGLVFLLAKFLPGLAWWSLWPLVIVVGGLVQAFTPGKEGWSAHRLFDGLVTAAFGGVLLATTTGFIEWGVWPRILSLWPVLLIAVGFDILGKALHTSWLRVLGSLAIIAALAYAVLTATGGFQGIGWAPGGTSGEDVSISERVGTVREASLVLDAGVADVNIGSGMGLVSIDGTSPWGQPDFGIERAGAQANIAARLGAPEGSVYWPAPSSASYDIGLSNQVKWDLRVNAGIASIDADLSDVPVRSLDLRPGVAECDVTLGAVPEGEREAHADVRAGVSDVRVRIPEGVPARVKIDSGLTGTSVGDDFTKGGDGAWVTPGYEIARTGGKPVWDITVRSGVGSISIDTYQGE